jgi:hypothetical protein
MVIDVDRTQSLQGMCCLVRSGQCKWFQLFGNVDYFASTLNPVTELVILTWLSSVSQCKTLLNVLLESYRSVTNKPSHCIRNIFHRKISGGTWF